LRNVPEGRCDRSLARSAWDSTIPKEPSRRVRCDSRRFGHRFDDWSDEIWNTKTEKKFVVLFLAYDTISFHGKHFLVPEHSLRFQHEGTCLNPDLRERLWPYMGGIAKQHGMIPKCIGGVSDHVHLLVTLPTRLAVAKAVQLIKAGSSAWIHLGLATPDHTVPYGTVLSRDAVPGTSCQATIGVVPTGRACRHFATASS
jgi:hypothetical protein